MKREQLKFKWKSVMFVSFFYPEDKMLFGRKCMAINDTGLHSCLDTFLCSKKNVCILGAKVLFMCWRVIYFCLCSFTSVQETKFNIWMSFNSSHLCVHWNFQEFWHGRMQNCEHIVSPHLINTVLQ